MILLFLEKKSDYEQQTYISIGCIALNISSIARNGRRSIENGLEESILRNKSIDEYGD